MQHLLFKNPSTQFGLNVTVRDGSKWADTQAGELLVISDSSVEGKALDIDTALAIGSSWFANVTDIPEELLKFEHDSSCRETIGLIHALDDAYGKGEWGADGLVVLFFWV